MAAMLPASRSCSSGGRRRRWEGCRVAVEGTQGFFRAGVKGLVAEADLGAGYGEGLQGLQHLARHTATATAGEAFELGEPGIALLRSVGGCGREAAPRGRLDFELADARCARRYGCYQLKRTCYELGNQKVISPPNSPVTFRPTPYRY
ncbi:hypothetical protein [Accumulibacter sp.]|jgi:hypothetical protein|uniref:Uncharacterized protein n=1 Tax=Accumulibacter regalis TaxID=522306 RepID=C7RUC2_ACCRE|nr:hypothetical protein [Accumulibacter sp.]MBN8499157.1 hypothetical protein [Accumulibacter sp.]